VSLRKNLTLIYASLLVSVLVAGASAQASAQLPKPGDAPAGSPVAKHGQLSVSGNTIKDKAGNDVVLRGVSFFWSNSDQSGWYNDAVVGWLVHDWNVSVVRAAMGVAEKDGGGNKGYADGDSSAQYGLVKNVVEAAIKRGIYVLVDWHSHSAQDYTSKATKFFENIARTYGAYPNIIYETYNEPTTDWGTIVNYSNTVTSAIRAIDSKNVIVIGTPGYSSQPNAGTASGTNLTYSMHFYSGSNDHRQPYRDLF
jgi:endoglucanase